MTPFPQNPDVSPPSETSSGGGVILVTGAGRRRVGAHVAELFASRGYRLAIHYRTAAAEAEEAVARHSARGVEAAAFRADLTDERQVDAMVEAVLGRFGRIDALVHCAATWRPKSLEETMAADVRDAFETNTLATFLCARRAGLAMAARPEGGCIVTVGDWACTRPYPGYAAYFASKGAIPAITRSLAVELGTRNPRVRANCILPGPVMLPEDLPEEERREAIEATLARREGSPEDVARAALFLVESGFVTGACLPVDGGRSIWAGGR